MPATPKRGRPLDPEVDAAIVAAATAMFLEGGLQRMTVPGVAAAAGVAKTTVYRRYATPAQLALAAIGRLNADASDPDTGSARTDLIATLEAVRQRIDPTVTATVLVEAQTHPEILELARRQMIIPAVERFRRILRKGVETGELKRGLDADLAADAVLGSFFMRFYERGRPGPDWPRQVVDSLYPGLTEQG
ncbi:TetR/AcrR family transcriptional regulator C-terminal ligand-binding domain-containing protein [Solirubrobacter phytolaccae]|uniref:TetR/AcrR family transcriptional regulator C-terminal ligand-binding domain-containing protein n=1 Tax=Solirubrobacter phytolaccae TaxID=1404360 RepID=A0A9X3N2Y9_9ACTN|nr:TetR-like C-terminal domain-containing protein [Solirubrobacter phytolaccae]MDA0178855.1 TetR/AcrR family transcriptional regulator C-terminal ligand-binding domain-containing protein [Solirubrobacter phytolaccae]